MVSLSVSDRELDWFGGLGFSGSLADRQNSYSALGQDLSDLPIYLYGNSLAVLVGQAFYTAGGHYSQKVASSLRANDPVSYAVGGRRILDICSTLINGGALLGVTGQIAAGKWPGVSQRKGLIVIDSLQNDIPHYAAMNVNPLVPVALPANTQYLDGVKSMFRTALALISSESRIEQDAGGVVRTGAWTPSANAAYSNGGLHFTSTIGDNILWPAVTPPQVGPLAGKVFVLGYKLAAAVGVEANTINISVDGGANIPWTPNAWEAYTNVGGASSTIIPDVIPVTLPVDGAAHSIRMTHAGAAGQFMYADTVIIPSESPYPIAVMEATASPKVVAGVYDQAAVNTWIANRGPVADAARQVVQEFSHAIWIADNRSQNGIYSVDGIHPNDRGMSQRAADLLYGIQQGLVDSRLRDLANSNFGVI